MSRASKAARRVTEHQLFIQLPIDFVRALYAFAREFTDDVTLHLLPKEQLLDVYLSTAGMSAVCQMQLVLSSNWTKTYSLHVANHELLESGTDELQVQTHAKELITTLNALRTGSSHVRFYICEKWDAYECQTGNIIEEQKIVPTVAAATPPTGASRKRSASHAMDSVPAVTAVAASAVTTTITTAQEVQVKHRWDYNAQTTIPKYTFGSLAESAIAMRPPSRYVIRVDLNYLLKKFVTMLKTFEGDATKVEISFAGVVERVLPSAAAAASAEEDAEVDEPLDAEEAAIMDRMRTTPAVVAAASAAAAEAAAPKRFTPTHLNFCYFSANSKKTTTERMEILDRRKEWATLKAKNNQATAAAAAATATSVKDKLANHPAFRRFGATEEAEEEAENIRNELNWRTGEIDPEKVLEEKRDIDLGIDKREARLADLYEFPDALSQSPPFFVYDVKMLIRMTRMANFARHGRLHWTESNTNGTEQAIPGAMWFCVPISGNGTRGCITGVIAPTEDVAGCS